MENFIFCAVKKQRHEKKLLMLRKTQNTRMDNKVNIKYIKNTVHNFSSYFLSGKEKIALSYRLEQHIPIKSNSDSIYKEFEHFYQKIFNNITNIPQDDLSKIKTNMKSTCEKYSQINVPYEYRKIVKDLSSNSSIIILQQDKGRGIVKMDRRKHLHKCFDILNTEQFIKLPNNPTSSIEKKVQRNLRKIKQKLPKDIYIKLYPTGSSPVNFMAQPRFTSYRPMAQMMIYLFDQLFLTSIQQPTNWHVISQSYYHH